MRRSHGWPRCHRGWLVLVVVVVLAGALAAAQQVAPPNALPAPARTPTAEFLHAADEVLDQMSALLELPVKTPLKKTLRSRAEIRTYLIEKMKEERDPAKRYADQKTLERFGLLPKGFALEAFLVDLLTEQVAGLYDPKGHEFFIADWIPGGEQRIVMAHELTHALHDQHFEVEKWVEAAKPNDDGELARQAVLEGAAIAAMLDYAFAAQGSRIRVRSMPELDARMLIGSTDASPELAKAPPFLRDTLLFPYTSGAMFTHRVLQSGSGWGEFKRVFENPPASSQQILHPELYLEGVKPVEVILPDLKPILAAPWKQLDANVLGEFGLLEVLKQRLPEKRAEELAAFWKGDRYAILENGKTKHTALVFRVDLGSEANALRFYGSYSELLELKYGERQDLLRRPSFFSFDTEEGSVFLRCFASECITLEGGTRGQFDALVGALGWPRNPAVPRRPAAPRKPQIAWTSPLAAPAAFSPQ